MKYILYIIALLFPVSSYAAFADVHSSFYLYDVLDWAQESNIVQGYSDNTFRPEATINRAEFVKIIVKSLDSHEEECISNNFPDVASTAWYAPYICQAHALGIIDGYPDGSFRPGASVNVAEAAKIITTLHSKGKIVQGTNSDWYTPFITYLQVRNTFPARIYKANELLSRGNMMNIMYALEKNEYPPLQIGQETRFENVDFSIDLPKNYKLNTSFGNYYSFTNNTVPEQPTIFVMPERTDTSPKGDSVHIFMTDESGNVIILDTKNPKTNYFSNQVYVGIATFNADISGSTTENPKYTFVYTFLKNKTSYQQELQDLVQSVVIKRVSKYKPFYPYFPHTELDCWKSQSMWSPADRKESILQRCDFGLSNFDPIRASLNNSVLQAALAEDNPELCLELHSAMNKVDYGGNVPVYAGKCLHKYAVTTDDPQICNLARSWDAMKCNNYFAEKNNDPALCSFMDSYEKIQCVNKFIHKGMLKLSACDQFTHPDSHMRCVYGPYQWLENAETCEMMESSNFRDNCFKKFGLIE